MPLLRERPKRSISLQAFEKPASLIRTTRTRATTSRKNPPISKLLTRRSRPQKRRTQIRPADLTRRRKAVLQPMSRYVPRSTRWRRSKLPKLQRAKRKKATKRRQAKTHFHFFEAWL